MQARPKLRKGSRSRFLAGGDDNIPAGDHVRVPQYLPQAALDAVADNCFSYSLANRKAEPGVFSIVPSGSHHQ